MQRRHYAPRIYTHGPSLSIAQMRYGHRGFDGWTSSPSRGRFQTAPTSRLGSFGRNRSKSGKKTSAESRIMKTPRSSTYLIRRLRLELLKDFERLLLCGKAAHIGQNRGRHGLVSPSKGKVRQKGKKQGVL